MADPAVPEVPALVTWPGVEILATGQWNLSSGPATFTLADLASAIDAASCPAVGSPVIKLGHTDKRFTPGDGEPAIGRVANLALAAEGNKITGDLAGMPGWLGEILPSAYPQRSIEGAYDLVCQIGHVHPFVITALALLGVTPPGVGVLNDLEDVAALYGVTATGQQAASAWTLPSGDPMSGIVLAAGVTTEDVRRAYYDGPAASNFSLWITEMQLDPPQLIVADESTSKVYRVPVKIKGSVITFGDQVEVEVEYVDVAAAQRGRGRAAAGPAESRVRFASAEESRRGVAAAEPGKDDDEDDPEAGGEGDPEQVEAGAHGAVGEATTHSHEHSAYGEQGGDATHSHSHSHPAGTAVHDHEHAQASKGDHEVKGAAEMDFSDEQMAALRKRLGKGDDAELTADEILAALAGPAEGEGGKVAAARLPEGVVAIDKDVWEATQQRIRQGEMAREKQLKNEMEGDIAAAIRSGRVPLARKAHWERLWSKDPEGTRTVLASLTPGVVPLDDIGMPGGPGDELLDAEYQSIFPPAYKREAAQG